MAQAIAATAPTEMPTPRPALAPGLSPEELGVGDGDVVEDSSVLVVEPGPAEELSVNDVDAADEDALFVDVLEEDVDSADDLITRNPGLDNSPVPALNVVVGSLNRRTYLGLTAKDFSGIAIVQA